MYFVLVAILAITVHGYEVNKRLSFSAPFKDYNYDGTLIYLFSENRRKSAYARLDVQWGCCDQ